MYLRFNPRSREGNDAAFARFFHSSGRFQSTFPRGERRYTATNGTFSPEFQSTVPRGERRHCFQTLCVSLIVSIHVPARGTTVEGWQQAAT